MSKASFTALASLGLLLVVPAFHGFVFALVRADPYVNSTHRFSINPPSGWNVDDSGTFGTSVVFLGPTETNFRVNMNVVVESTSLTLSEYVSTAKAQLPLLLTNYSLVSERSRTIGGVGAYELVATFAQGAFDLKNQQVFFVESRKAYVVTSTALQTNYDTYSPSFDESVQTFRLTGAEFPWLIVIVIVAVVAGVAVGLAIFLRRRKPEVKVPPAVPETTTSPPQP